MGLRIVVTGASGNVGTALVERLEADDRVSSVTGVARRPPADRPGAKLSWVRADIATADLLPHLAGADVLVHLAWLFQPTHRPTVTWEANVVGSKRLLDAAGRAGVSAVVHASSVGAYSPGPGPGQAPGSRVPESWPTHSTPTAAYGREKAYVERLLDSFSAEHPDVRVVRLRPGFVFQRPAATQQRRLFAGPFVPRQLVEPGRLPFLPVPAGLRFQAVHADDVAHAYQLAATTEVTGPFNVAAEPVVNGRTLAELLDTRLVELPRQLVRAGLATAWRAHLTPAEPALLDLVMDLPLMDTSRALDEMRWQPQHTAVDAIQEMLDGLAAGAGTTTPPLAPDTPSGRLHEVATGVGEQP